MSRYWVQVYGPNIKGGPFGASDEYVVESATAVVPQANGGLVIDTAEIPAKDGHPGRSARRVYYMPGQVTRFVTGEVRPR